MKNNLKSLEIAAAGLRYILLFGILSALFLPIPSLFFKSVGLLFLILTLFCIYFFRDPERTVPKDLSYIVAPADGKVLEIVQEYSPQMREKVTVIKIFLSIFNVHVQRSPISGKIAQIDYKEGKFLDARNPKASEENENNSITIESENCKMVVKQIAGLLARRILCWVNVGQSVGVGERLGLIQFGSQVDLYLPKNMEILCGPGDRVTGGETVIALNKGIAR